MAFAYTVTKRIRPERAYKMAWGTFTNGTNDSGGAIVTGFKSCNFFIASINSHLSAAEVKHTISGGTVTIVTGDDIDGTWFAIGV